MEDLGCEVEKQELSILSVIKDQRAGTINCQPVAFVQNNIVYTNGPVCDLNPAFTASRQVLGNEQNRRPLP